MRRTTCLCLLTAASALTACSTPQPVASAPAPVALGALGPATTDMVGEPSGPFYFGAGDAIGQEIFTYYVACLRLNEHYATGGVDFPADE